MRSGSISQSIADQVRNGFRKFKENNILQSASGLLNGVLQWFRVTTSEQNIRQPNALRYELLESRQVLSAEAYPIAPDDGGDEDPFLSDAYIPVWVDGVFEFGDLAGQFPYGKENTFKLESNPSATKTIYLDYTGFHSVNNWWNHDIVFPAFDRDGNPNSFSDDELSEIQKQFLHVAEDFLPFDVNVTTKDPGSEALRKSGPGDNRWGVRSLNTQYTDGFGNGTGGIAHLNSFDASIDNPIFSFNKGARNGGMTNSHEIGHSLGLRHDGLGSQSYHPGTGSGETSWGPIMGAPFGKNLVQWSDGNYANSTNTEDDLSIITRNRNGFGFRTDDHGNSTANATALDVTNDTEVSKWGIIERNTDLDFFSFNTGPGTISINIDALTFNPSLDVEAKLLNAAGQVIATSNPGDKVGASFDLDVSGGSYFIAIDGVGKSGVYTDYGSLGFYEISGVIVDPVNDIPTLAPIDDLILNEDAGEQTVLLRGITAGMNESQPLRVTATSTNFGLIPNPEVSYVSPERAGFLTFTPVQTKNGFSTVTVTVEDGGFDNDLDTSEDNATFTRTFDVIVNPVNDPPTLSPISDVIINEDAGQQVINLAGITDGDEGFQPLRVTATSDNPSLIPQPTVEYDSPSSTGILKFTPAADQFGSALVSVLVEDGGDDNNLSTKDDNLTFTRTFIVRVNAVNDKPTISAIPNQSLDEDESREITLAGITAGGGENQPLRVWATSSNLALMANPQVDYTPNGENGTLQLVPNTDATGSTVISVTVEDGGLDQDLSTENDNAIYTRTFVVDVAAVNDTPTLNPLDDMELMEDAGQQVVELGGISAGSGESQPLLVTVVSSNEQLISNQVVDYTSPSSSGELIFQSNSNRFGTAVLTVTVEDGGLDGNLATKDDNGTFSQSFTVVVNPVNDVPEFNVPHNVQADKSKGLNEIKIGGINAGPFEDQPLRFSVTTDSPNFITNLTVDYSDPNGIGSVTFDPIYELGRGKINLTLEDGGLDGDLATSNDNGVTTKTIDVMVTTKTTSFATTDDTTFGYVEGTYGDTYWRSRSSQDITETRYGDGNRTRLDHRWKFDLQVPNVSVEFLVFAGHNATNEQFSFEYQVDGTSSWKHLVTTNQNLSRKYYAKVVDSDLANGESIWVRVRDTNRGVDNEAATLQVQKVYVLSRRVEEAPISVNAFVFDKTGSEQNFDKAQIRFQLADRMRLDRDVDVYYEVGGTARNGDYREFLSGVKTIRAGNFMTRLMITPYNDVQLEGNESVTVKLIPKSEYRITGSGTASVKILDSQKVTYEAVGEVSYLGKHAVHYPQSFYDDGAAEIIRESRYGNRTMLNHQWKFATGGEDRLKVEGRLEILSNPYVDSFQVSYSTDQKTWKSLGRLRYGRPLELQKLISVDPGSDHVWVRVHDRYRQSHDTHIARIAVSHLRLVKTHSGGTGAFGLQASLTNATDQDPFRKVAPPNFVPSLALMAQPASSIAFGDQSNDFVLPEFYHEDEHDEVDSVFLNWQG